MNEHKNTTIGLLPWEISLLFFTIGCLGYEHPFPALIGLILLTYILGVQNPHWNSIFFCILGCAGFVYTSLRIPPAPEPSAIPIPTNEKVMVEGKVADSSWRYKSHLYVYVKNVLITNDSQQTHLPGLLLLVIKHAEHAPLPGQGLHARIKIKPVHSLKNPGCWDGEAYWQRKKVYWKAYVRDMDTSIDWTQQKPSFWEKLRRNLRGTLMTTLSDEKGKGLALALLLGDKSHLTSETYTLLQKAGLVHTLALSGLHLGFVASFGWGAAWLLGFLFPRLYLVIPRMKLAALLAFPCVFMYMWLGGFTPSLLRAGIMLASWAILSLCNRGRVLIDGLCLAILLIILWSPANVFSISFQFSVLAVAGIMYFIPPVQSLLHVVAKKGLWGRILNYGLLIAAVSIVANMLLLPIQIWNFGTVTIHLYYNIVWIPILGFIVLPLGFAGLCLSQIPHLEYLGAELLKAMGWILENGYALLKTVEKDGWLQSIHVLRPEWPEIIGFYTLLVLFLLTWRYRILLHKKAVVMVCSGLILLCSSFFSGTLANRQQELRLIVLDTGMSQAVYMELPGGKRILIDGGGSWSRDFDMGKAVIVPVITWGMPPTIDAVFLTHSDCDHLRGLFYPLETCQVGKFYFTGCYPSGLWDRRRLISALKGNSIPVKKIFTGQNILVGNNTVIEVLHPNPEDLGKFSNNDRSLVLRVVINGKGRVLIPGDIEQTGIVNLLARQKSLRADVLILPHHGSSTSYSPILYDKVSPKLAIAAAGKGNRYGFPAPTVTTALEKKGCPVLTTARCGAVEIVWKNNENQMDVRVMRTSGWNSVNIPLKNKNMTWR